MSVETAKPGDTVELKEKDGGFYDSETGFQIRNEEKVQLGDTIGRRTNTAIVSGGLLVVGGKPKSISEDAGGVKTDSDLPEDFPGREAFAAAKMNLEQVKDFNFETGKVAGVGAGTIRQLGEYFKQ